MFTKHISSTAHVKGRKYYYRECLLFACVLDFHVHDQVQRRCSSPSFKKLGGLGNDRIFTDSWKSLLSSFLTRRCCSPVLEAGSHQRKFGSFAKLDFGRIPENIKIERKLAEMHRGTSEGRCLLSIECRSYEKWPNFAGPPPQGLVSKCSTSGVILYPTFTIFGRILLPYFSVFCTRKVRPSTFQPLRLRPLDGARQPCTEWLDARHVAIVLIHPSWQGFSL